MPNIVEYVKEKKWFDGLLRNPSEYNARYTFNPQLPFIPGDKQIEPVTEEQQLAAFTEILTRTLEAEIGRALYTPYTIATMWDDHYQNALKLALKHSGIGGRVAEHFPNRIVVTLYSGYVSARIESAQDSIILYDEDKI